MPRIALYSQVIWLLLACGATDARSTLDSSVDRCRAAMSCTSCLGVVGCVWDTTSSRCVADDGRARTSLCIDAAGDGASESDARQTFDGSTTLDQGIRDTQINPTDTSVRDNATTPETGVVVTEYTSAVAVEELNQLTSTPTQPLDVQANHRYAFRSTNVGLALDGVFTCDVQNVRADAHLLIRNPTGPSLRVAFTTEGSAVLAVLMTQLRTGGSMSGGGCGITTNSPVRSFHIVPAGATVDFWIAGTTRRPPVEGAFALTLDVSAQP